MCASISLNYMRIRKTAIILGASLALMTSLASLYQDALKTYREKPALAKELAATPEAAALVLCANAILNTDEALTK